MNNFHLLSQWDHKLLWDLTVDNFDDGNKFTDTTRLSVIEEELFGSEYLRIPSFGLFHLYGKRALTSESKNVVIVSSHVDLNPKFRHAFCDLNDNIFLRGTLDNSATNMVAVKLMTRAIIPDNVYFAFTGNGTGACTGARDLVRFLIFKHVNARIITLDVGNNGFKSDAYFTVENNYLQQEFGNLIFQYFLKWKDIKWLIVPSYLGDIPSFIPRSHLVRYETNPDESWAYHNYKMECVSVCLPASGKLDEQYGIIISKHALKIYADVLSGLLKETANLEN